LTDVYGLSWTFISQGWYNFFCNCSFVTLFEMYINKK
jgi:hypothetical protein